MQPSLIIQHNIFPFRTSSYYISAFNQTNNFIVLVSIDENTKITMECIGRRLSRRRIKLRSKTNVGCITYVPRNARIVKLSTYLSGFSFKKKKTEGFHKYLRICKRYFITYKILSVSSNAHIFLNITFKKTLNYYFQPKVIISEKILLFFVRKKCAKFS